LTRHQTVKALQIYVYAAPALKDGELVRTKQTYSLGGYRPPGYSLGRLEAL
jgi:hypothetical protein